jgi:hypothetical protein
MDNLAVAYRLHGRPADAVAMQESVLELQRRVPGNHLGIGEIYLWNDALHAFC